MDHICFGCEYNNRLIALREKLLEDIWVFHPALCKRVRCLSVVDERLLITVALNASFVRCFGHFLLDVFTYVEEYHMYTPPPDI